VARSLRPYPHLAREEAVATPHRDVRARLDPLDRGHRDREPTTESGGRGVRLAQPHLLRHRQTPHRVRPEQHDPPERSVELELHHRQALTLAARRLVPDVQPAPGLLEVDVDQLLAVRVRRRRSPLEHERGGVLHAEHVGPGLEQRARPRDPLVVGPDRAADREARSRQHAGRSGRGIAEHLPTGAEAGGQRGLARDRLPVPELPARVGPPEEEEERRQTGSPSVSQPCSSHDRIPCSQSLSAGPPGLEPGQRARVVPRRRRDRGKPGSRTPSRGCDHSRKGARLPGSRRGTRFLWARRPGADGGRPKARRRTRLRRSGRRSRTPGFRWDSGRPGYGVTWITKSRGAEMQFPRTSQARTFQ
jgi:hypothetical protein